MHVGNEENVRQIMQHRVHMGGSDAILHGNILHPRAYGTFSRYLGEASNEPFSVISIFDLDLIC
jgi:N-acyl-D-amino-acid deacylase